MAALKDLARYAKMKTIGKIRQSIRRDFDVSNLMSKYKLPGSILGSKNYNTVAGHVKRMLDSGDSEGVRGLLGEQARRVGAQKRAAQKKAIK